jgi:hypothetical protein
MTCAGLQGAREPDRGAMAMSRDHRQALRLRAARQTGPSRRSCWRNGFTIEMLDALVRNGLATATPETVHAGKRPIEVVRVQITDAGRLALAG